MLLSACKMHSDVNGSGPEPRMANLHGVSLEFMDVITLVSRWIRST